MSGARRRSKSSWDNKEEAKIPFDSSFHGDTSPKRSNSEAYDVFMSDDFPHEPLQPNENIPYRGGNRGSGNRDRSRSPRRHRVKDRDHGIGIGRGSEERQRESYDDSNSRASSYNRPCKDYVSGNCRKGSQCRFLHQEQHEGSRFRDDRNKDSYSDGYRKDNSDYHRGNNNNNNRNNNSYDSVKPPCRFFLMGNCNRNRCKFSHDAPKVDGYQERSHDDNNNNNNRNLDDKNKSWNDLESMANQESSHIHSYQNPTTLNGDEKSPDMNGGSKLLEASRNGIPNETLASMEQVPRATEVSNPEKQILANALELLYSLPNSGSSNAPVSDSIKTSVPVGTLADSQEQGNRIPVESESVGVADAKEEENEKKKDESLKNTNSGKVEEGDEKAMRQFKNVLVEFVKEILKPTWKEGKMSREVYKTIVKKVVEKVSSSIQGVQIPRTQEKIDQYLAFSKSKITKLVEAYVGRLLKG